MKQGISILFLGIVLILTNCQPDFNKHNTPEAVLKQYQFYFDNNEFEKAKALSTFEGKQWIDDIAPMIVNEFSDSTILKTIFNELDCKIEKDTAICFCELEDENESYPAEYRLIRFKGNWLVDAPDEGEIIEYEDEDELLDNFQKQ